MATDRGTALLAEFEEQVAERALTWATQLPPNLSKDKFVAVLLSAVRANPSLLSFDRRLLFAELTKAANDGILVDGREGALVVRPTKNGGETIAYQPMVHGIRKRARELDNLILDAKCVRENDGWEHEEGDDAYIKHTPLPEWKGQRGKLVAVYLIVRQFNPGVERDVILHREVMYQRDVMAVKSKSKRQTADHWTTFEEEGWKKSVVHRGIKSVPSVTSTALKTILSRDYEEFDFNRGDTTPGPFDGLPASAATVPLPPPSNAAAPKLIEKTSAEPSPKSEPPKQEEKSFATKFLDRMDAALDKASTLDEAKKIYGKGDAAIENRKTDDPRQQFTDADRERAYVIWDKHEKRLTAARSSKKKAAA